VIATRWPSGPTGGCELRTYATAPVGPTRRRRCDYGKHPFRLSKLRKASRSPPVCCRQEGSLPLLQSWCGRSERQRRHDSTDHCPLVNRNRSVRGRDFNGRRRKSWPVNTSSTSGIPNGTRSDTSRIGSSSKCSDDTDSKTSTGRRAATHRGHFFRCSAGHCRILCLVLLGSSKTESGRG